MTKKEIAKKFIKTVKESTEGKLRAKGLIVFVHIEDWKEELTNDSKIIIGLKYLDIDIFKYIITKDNSRYIDAPIILSKRENADKISQFLSIMSIIIKFKTSLLKNLMKFAEELRGGGML